MTKFNTTQIVWELRFDIYLMAALFCFLSDHIWLGAVLFVGAVIAGLGSYWNRDEQSSKTRVAK